MKDSTISPTDIDGNQNVLDMAAEGRGMGRSGSGRDVEAQTVAQSRTHKNAATEGTAVM